MREVDVCVVGAGPVGGGLACRLAAGGARVAVIDTAALPPMEHPAFDGRAYAITAGSRQLLEQGGVWDALPLPVCPMEDILVTSGRVGRAASPLRLAFDSQDAGAGPFGWMVEARALRVALNARLNATEGLTLFAPAAARVERDASGATVTVSTGDVLRCRLVVAAEGRRSPLREQAGIPVTRIPYRVSGLVAAVAHELPHANTALEHFLPSGPFAQLPMAGTDGAPHASAIVWTEEQGLAARLHRAEAPVFTRELQRRLGDRLGALRLIGGRWLYPLSAMFAHRSVDRRLALVGDSAHGIHPIAGQGLNLGFRDAVALSRLVLDALGTGRDPGSSGLLAAFQRERRGANLLMLGATDALDRLFSNDIGWLRPVRGLGLAAVDRVPALKRVFMRQAMGAPATIGGAAG